MSCDLVDFGKSFAFRTSCFGFGSALAAQIGVWAGTTVISVGALTALGLGAGVGAISAIAHNILGRFELFKNEWILLASTTVIGSSVTYGLYTGAVALGFVATPITVPTALILTATGLGILILLKGIVWLAQGRKPSEGSHKLKESETEVPKPEGQRVNDILVLS